MSIRIPYGRQTIDQGDIDAVAEVLRSDWLTQGPKVDQFEKALAAYCGAKYAVTYANGTIALQGAYYAAGIGKGDEIVTTPITFAATSTAALWQGARPVFADINTDDGNLSAADAAKALTPRTKAIVPVHFAGRPVDLAAFQDLCRKNNLLLIEDGCHALGASYDGKKIGGFGDMTVFSFHPVKSITTGEGGAVLTNDAALYEKLSLFRKHGIKPGADWEYAVEDQGVNSRLTDLQCALGLSQLAKLDGFVAKRQAIADRYDRLFKGWAAAEPLERAGSSRSSWHLYVFRFKGEHGKKRRAVFQALRAAGIGVQVHYIPVYRHPFYERLGYNKGLCPKAEDFYERILSLPIYPTLTETQQDEVVAKLKEAIEKA